MRACLLALIAVTSASAQVASSPYPYLLRLDHYGFDEHACVLLQNTGMFHLEIDHGDDVRVHEGSVDPRQLAAVQSDLNSEQLLQLSQPQIEEPIMRTRRDRLQVTIFRGNGWQNLYFASGDSQQPFKPWLQPLVSWLNELHKAPHRELSEDAGKNNCLPPKVIALQKRGATVSSAPQASGITMDIFSSRAPAVPPPATSAGTPVSAPVQMLLHLSFLQIKSGSAQERCFLVADDGNFRLEDRFQKSNKRVSTEIAVGQMRTEEVQQLREILEDPRLARIKHREPPGGRIVPMLGDMLELSIARPQGNQRVVLSSAFGRSGFPAFFGGDADVSDATPLLKFVTEHIEKDKKPASGVIQRNGCTELR